MELSSTEIMALLAGFLTAFAFVPQVFQMVKAKNADGVSALTFLMLFGSYILGLVYGLSLSSSSIILWNILAILFCGAVLFIKFFILSDKK